MRRRSNSAGRRFRSYSDAVPAIKELRSNLSHKVEMMTETMYNDFRKTAALVQPTKRTRDQECAASFEWPFVQSLKNRLAIMTQLEFEDGLHWIAVTGDLESSNNVKAYSPFAIHWKAGSTPQPLSAYDTVLAMVFERVPRWAMRKMYRVIAYIRSRNWSGRGWIFNSSLGPNDEDIIRWAWLDAEWVELEVLGNAKLAFVKSLDRWVFAGSAYGRSCQSLDINKPCGFTIDLKNAPSDRDYQSQRYRAESTLPQALRTNIQQKTAFLFYDLDVKKWCYLDLTPRDIAMPKRSGLASLFPRVWQRVTLWGQYVAV